MAIIQMKPKDDPSAAWPSILVGMFVAFGGVLYGYDTGTISGIQEMDFWRNEFFPNAPVQADGGPGVDSSRISLIVSILSVGTFFGALCAGFVADFFGRKWGIILSCLIPFNLGVLLQVISTETNLFIVGRVFAGFGVGLISVQVPMYQSETLPKWIRGAVVGSYQLCITIGLLVASLINYGTQNLDNSGSYRIPLAIQFAWSLILSGGLFFLPETPRYLIKKSKHERALKSLVTLRRLPGDHPHVEAELAEIQANYNYEMSLGSASWFECFRGTIGKRLFTGCALQSLQQLVGINFIFYYGTTYFANNTTGALPGAFLLGVTTNVVNTVSTFPGLVAIDKMGRRPVLLIGAIGMFVCQYIVAILYVATPSTNSASQVAQFCFICFYIFFFASTWGPAAWVVTGEMFPLKVRGKCMSLTTASNWLFNFVLAFITPYLEDTTGQYVNLEGNIFWIWGGFCLIAVVFVYFFIYETKNLTLEEVNELYGVCSKAYKSRAFRPQVSFAEAEKTGVDRRASLVEIGQDQQRRRSSVMGEKNNDTYVADSKF